MRQETIVKTYLKFDELNEAQKLKVIENYRHINTELYDWYEYVYEDQKTILTMLGFSEIKIQFSGFSCQGDGASFTGYFTVPKTVKELKERVKNVKEYAPKLNLYNFVNMRFTKEEKENDTYEIFRISSHYSHSNTVSCDHVFLKDFVRSYSDSIYRTLEADYDYQTSDEAIKETILANDYEFDSTTLKLA